MGLQLEPGQRFIAFVLPDFKSPLFACRKIEGLDLSGDG